MSEEQINPIVPPERPRLTPEQKEEARRLFREEACHNEGHDFDILVSGTGDPAAVLCARCRLQWPVEGGPET